MSENNGFSFGIGIGIGVLIGGFFAYLILSRNNSQSLALSPIQQPYYIPNNNVQWQVNRKSDGSIDNINSINPNNINNINPVI